MVVSLFNSTQTYAFATEFDFLKNKLIFGPFAAAAAVETR